MGEVAVYNVFYGANITVVGLQSYWRDLAHNIFHGASIAVAE